jgi:hypothetical protein
MATVKNLKNWSEFQQEVANLRSYCKELSEEDEHSYVPPLLFRGQSNTGWELQTTLERYNANVVTWLDYFRIASAARAEIESLADRRWGLPKFEKMSEWATRNSPWIEDMPGYDYLVYLRHHGFPSPLLDWSRSPYVAAFFAFRSPGTSDVAIYAYLEQTGSGKGGLASEPTIHTQGRHVTAHARHIRQQCEYTICTSYDDELRIAQHEEVFVRGEEDQDLLWKFTLPANERMPVLRELDSYNLNAFSLFQTEDALLETTALREIEFSERFRARPSKGGIKGNASS